MASRQVVFSVIHDKFDILCIILYNNINIILDIKLEIIMFNKIINFLRRRWLVLTLIAVVLIGIFFLLKPKKSSIEYSTVSQGRITAEVSVTGKVKPVRSLDLAFERSGRINKIAVNIGDSVKSGQILIVLENGDLLAQLQQAEASLKSQETKLTQLKKGTRAEDLAVYQNAVNNAESSLEDTKNNLAIARQKAEVDLNNLYASIIDTIDDAYNKTDDAVRKQASDMFINAESANPKLSFISTNSQAQSSAETERKIASQDLNTWSVDLNNLKNRQNSHEDLDQAMVDASNRLNRTLVFLTDLAANLNNAPSLSSTTMNTYKASVNTARTNIITALTNINDKQQTILAQKVSNEDNIATAKTSLTTTQNTLAQAQKQLALKQAGYSSEDISFQASQVDQAQANVNYYQALLNKTVLKSPFDGIITKINFEIGDIMQPNAAAISLIGKDKFEIEANITESDISKIKIGQIARVTLDAYGPDVIFAAKVVQIDLSATIIEGVATYKTVFQFTEEDEKILDGLTANIDVLVGEKDNVLLVSARDVVSRDGKKFVQVLVDEKQDLTEEREVEVGLRGTEGQVEIISGLKKGEKVISFKKQ